MWLSVMAIFLVYAVVFILFEDYNRKFVMPFNEVSDWQLLVFSIVVMAGLGFLLYRYAHRMDERISREQAEKENRLRRELTHNISHELKTPVASILGYTDTILESPDISEDMKRLFIERTNVQAKRLSALLQDISALNRMDYAKDMIAVERVDVSALFADILQEVGLDSLRELAGRVLTYDVSNIRGESLEATESYRQEVLGKMSRADLIRCILLQPTVKLSKTELNTGYEAQYIQNPLMNLYFTRDQSITTPRGHVICRMNSNQRAPETDIISLCYEHLGLKPILRVKGGGRLEGGDYIPAGNVSFIGCGMRTNDEGIQQLMEADAFGHDTVVVVRDHKFWQMQMHLDTYFNIIDSNLCTMVSSRLYAQEGTPEYGTCDIWTRRPGTRTYKLWKADEPFVKYLRARGFSIIPIDYDDEMHYANNFLTIAPRHIMAVGGQSEKFQQRLREAGVTVEWIPLESLIDGYGAAHCMTQVLQRAPYMPKK